MFGKTRADSAPPRPLCGRTRRTLKGLHSDRRTSMARVTENKRIEAIARVVALVAFVVLVAWWLIPVAIVAALLWMLTDVTLQLVTGEQAWTRHPRRRGTVRDWLARIAYWPVDMLNFIVFGDGSFPFIPQQIGS